MAGETGRIRLFTDDKEHRGLVLHEQRKLADWVGNLPVLFLNASGQERDVERFFSDVETVRIQEPELPYQRVDQYLGSFGKSERKPYKLIALTDEARAHRKAGRELLVLCHQQDEDEIRKRVPGVRLIHHGDAAGDDTNGDVHHVMQIGGHFAPPRQIAEMACARHGEPVPSAAPVRTMCSALMEDGTGVAFERMAYEQADAQFVHETIYDESFRQGGLARGRGIARTFKNQLRISVYGNVPLPVPLHSLQRWKVRRELKLFADGGLHSNAGDLAEFHDKTFKTEAAAAKWLQRHRDAGLALIQFLQDAPKLAVRITWQPQGQGHKPRRSLMPAEDALAFRQRLEASRGLALWRVEAVPGTGTEELDIPGLLTQLNMSGSSPGTAPAPAPPANGGNPPNPWWTDPTLGLPPWRAQAANDHQARAPPGG
jgi:hypothetical protein